MTEVVLKNETLTIRPRSWLPEGESLTNIICVLHSSPSQISLEPHVEGCSVHSPASFTSRNHDILTLPVSEENEYSNTYLRDGDTVEFQYHHFRLTVMPPADVARMVEQLAESSDESVESQIAVKQPALTTPAENIDSDDDADSEDAGSETESEDDNNSSPDAPTTAPTTVGVIAESPAGLKLNRAPSTQGGTLNSSAVEVDTTSPLFQKSRDSQTGGETQAQGDILMRQTAKFSVEANDDMVMQPTKKPSQTYANGRRSATPAVNAPNLHDSDEEGDEIVFARTDEATIPNTSDLVEPRQVAQKAASRSVSAGSKRKAADDDEEDEENTEVKPVPSPKKRQKGLPEAALPNSDKPSPRRMRPSTQVATLRSSPLKAKAKKGTGKGKGKRAATVELDENVTLAPPRSSARLSSPAKPSPSKSKKIKKGKASAPPPASAPPQSTPAKVSSILLSSAVTTSKPITAFLKKQFIKVVDDIPSKRTKFICVVPASGLATTAKVLRSLVLGKLVVTEEWLIDSATQQELLDPEDYLHPDLPNNEAEIDRSGLFAGRKVWFTKQLHMDYGKKGWASVEALVKEAGAMEVSYGATDYAAGAIRRGDTIFFGRKDQDADVNQLRDEHGQTVYSKDMLTQSIFTGELDLDSDAFVLKAPASAPKKGGKKR
ncbi:hypothetical protein LTR17_000421 [Elasticomyces elasticus]|nr:hypothetical protein LTR17_000421 [Elasticomyces elasticus]